MAISSAGFFAKWCTLPTYKVGQDFKWSDTKKPGGVQFLFKDSKCVSHSQTKSVGRFKTKCCFCRIVVALIHYTFNFFVMYLQWEHMEAAHISGYAHTTITYRYIFYMPLLFTLILCCFNIISKIYT